MGEGSRLLSKIEQNRVNIWPYQVEKKKWGGWIEVFEYCLCRKTVSWKIGDLIWSINFFSQEVALYFYESTAWPCMEHRCLVWAAAPKRYLDLPDKLQKQVLSGSWSCTCWLTSLAHRWCGQVKSVLYLLFGKYLAELTELFPLLFCHFRSAKFADKQDDFAVSIPRYCKEVFTNNFLPMTRLMEFPTCRLLAFDLQSKS